MREGGGRVCGAGRAPIVVPQADMLHAESSKDGGVEGHLSFPLASKYTCLVRHRMFSNHYGATEALPADHHWKLNPKVADQTAQPIIYQDSPSLFPGPDSEKIGTIFPRGQGSKKRQGQLYLISGNRQTSHRPIAGFMGAQKSQQHS